MDSVDALIFADDVRVQKAVARTVRLLAKHMEIQCVDPMLGYPETLRQVENWRSGARQRKLCLWHVGTGEGNSWLPRRFFNEHFVILQVLAYPMSSDAPRRVVMFGAAGAIRMHWISQWLAEFELPDVSVVNITDLLANLYGERYANTGQICETLERSGSLQWDFMEEYLGPPSVLAHSLASNNLAKSRAYAQALNEFVCDRRLTEASRASDVGTIKDLLLDYFDRPFHEPD